MRRPEKFPNLGKGYKIEWSQFQGTSPMSQALIAGALDCATQGVLPIAQAWTRNARDLRDRAACRREAGQLLGLLGGEGRLADQEGRGPEGQDRRHLDHRRRHAGPFNLMLKRAGVDPEKDIKLVEVSFSLSEDALRQGRVDFDQHEPAVRGARRGEGRHPQAVRAGEAVPNIVHIVEACRKDFVDKNPDLVKQYVKDITAGLKMALANRDETMKVVSEITKAPVAVLDTVSCSRATTSRASRAPRRISPPSRRCSTSIPTRR
jgi:ABC-type nitrate/sulfonate/bicarbonate transport system substrate-binding protein